MGILRVYTPAWREAIGFAGILDLSGVLSPEPFEMADVDLLGRLFDALADWLRAECWSAVLHDALIGTPLWPLESLRADLPAGCQLSVNGNTLIVEAKNSHGIGRLASLWPTTEDISLFVTNSSRGGCRKAGCVVMLLRLDDGFQAVLVSDCEEAAEIPTHAAYALGADLKHERLEGRRGKALLALGLEGWRVGESLRQTAGREAIDQGG